MARISIRKSSGVSPLAIGLINGAQLTQTVGVANVPDGTSDILWGDKSGNLAIWFVNGAQIMQSVGVVNVSSAWTTQSAGMTWGPP
jgi:hypothetical protein